MPTKVIHKIRFVNTKDVKSQLWLYKINNFIISMKETILQNLTSALPMVLSPFDNAKIQQKIR